MPFREDTLPLQNYDRQNAGAIAAKLSALTQDELRVIRDYEAQRGNRAIVLERIAELYGGEPWTGYDAQGVATSSPRGRHRSTGTPRCCVMNYERAHKARARIIRAAAAPRTSVRPRVSVRRVTARTRVCSRRRVEPRYDFVQAEDRPVPQ